MIGRGGDGSDFGRRTTFLLAANCGTIQAGVREMRWWFYDKENIYIGLYVSCDGMGTFISKFGGLGSTHLL